MTGQIGAQAQADLERIELALELEEADKIARIVDDLVVAAAPEVRAQQIGQIGIVRISVVEVVRRRVAPCRDLLGGGVAHRPDRPVPLRLHARAHSGPLYARRSLSL